MAALRLNFAMLLAYFLADLAPFLSTPITAGRAGAAQAAENAAPVPEDATDAAPPPGTEGADTADTAPLAPATDGWADAEGEPMQCIMAALRLNSVMLRLTFP
jgi:hypothetical protein